MENSKEKDSFCKQGVNSGTEQISGMSYVSFNHMYLPWAIFGPIYHSIKGTKAALHLYITLALFGK